MIIDTTIMIIPFKKFIRLRHCVNTTCMLKVVNIVMVVNVSGGLKVKVSASLPRGHGFKPYIVS